MPGTTRHESESDKKYLQMTIGELRKRYGIDVAKGCADNEKLADVLLKLPSLKPLIREYEARRFEKL